MTDQELLNECKIGLGYSENTTAVDKTIKQKMKIVKSFMRNAGVPETRLNNEMAVGVIAMGVSDIWDLSGGDVKFSPVFYTLLTQLTHGGEDDAS